jgi:protein SCO1/2
MARHSFRVLTAAALLAFALAACGPQARRYPLKGQVVAIAESHDQLTVKHTDIPGFMPAMTMGYRVKASKLIDGLAAGDLIDATLVVNDTDVYLTDIHRTGHAPVPPDAHPIKVMDVMAPGDIVPDDALTDQTGAQHRLSDWRGKVLAVTFVYTRCPLPDFCPLMDAHFEELQETLAADPKLRDRVHLVSISFDPQHDTLDVIREHAKMRGADPRIWSYLTGAPAAIDHLTSRFGVSALEGDDAGQWFTHNLRTSVIDRRGRFIKVYSGNDWTVASLLDDLRAAASAG